MHRHRTQLLACLAVLLLLGVIGLSLRSMPPSDASESKAAARSPAVADAATAHAPNTDRSDAPPNEMRPSSPTSLAAVLIRADARPREAVLTFATAEAYQRFLERAQHRGLTVLAQVDALLSVRVRYDSLASIEAEASAHAADLSDISANHLIRIPGIPPAKEERSRDPSLPFRNNTLSFLGAAGDHAQWGRGVTIAVLDTGVAPDPTFGPGRVHYLNVGLGTLPSGGAQDGHGASVAALAAGSAPDAPGVAPAASILSIRVSDANGTSDIFTVARGIVAAVDAGAPIINLSLGGYSTNAALTAAISYAEKRGVVIVAAAGNDQAAQLSWPAADPRVVSVGSVDAAGRQVAFSNSGPQLKITAPGYGVQTAWLEGQRVYVDGTSASTPLVAGAIAAVMSQNPAFTAQQAWDLIQKTTSDGGAPGPDADYGHGVLNLDWAMNAANFARHDPAIASHYYDATRNLMSVVVQNRSASGVSGLALKLNMNGQETRIPLPAISPGSTHVQSFPVSAAQLAADAGWLLESELLTPAHLTDANPGNNQRSSQFRITPDSAASSGP